MWNRNDLHDVRRELFGGYHSVRVWQLPVEPCPPFTFVLACELEPAGTVGVHVQAEDAELICFLEGEGVAIVGDVPREVGPGAVISLPLGSTLAIENASTDAPLRYLITKARSPRD